MTTNPAALAADAIAETWELTIGKRDRIQELIEEQFAPVLLALENENQILREELESARMGQP